MRKLFTLIIVSIFGIGIINAQTQPLNASFENWVTSDPGQLPEYWDGTNLNATVAQLECVTKDDTSPQDGSYSANLESKFVSVYGQDIFLPGIITLGKLDMVNQTVGGGVPYTERPATLSGYYKYSPVNNDTAFIGIYLVVGSNPDTIAAGGMIITDNVDVWTQFNIDLDYYLGENPDTMNIIFGSSNNQDQNHEGSVLIVDNISLSGNVTSVNNIVTGNDFIISPNPANGYFNLKMSNVNNTIVNVHNTVGQVVITKTFNSSNINERFDVSDLNKGIYFVEVINNGKSNIKKLVIR